MTHLPRLLTTISLTAILAACSAADDTAPETPPETEVAATPAAVPTLTENWVIEGFDAPESVVSARDASGHYYVSNVGGGGSDKDGNGVISIITGDGQMVSRNWVGGTDALPLHAPKGMAVWDGTLYVTDIDHLVLIDIDSKAITARIPAPGAQFLNDVSASGQGVFLSDSGAATVLKLENGAITPWLTDNRLGGINGLLPQANRLLITTMTAGELLSVDWNSKAITGLAAGMENADGVNQMEDGSYLISSWPGQLWHVRDNEPPTLLQDTRAETPEASILMNDVLYHDGQVIAPNWMPGTVRGYGVE